METSSILENITKSSFALNILGLLGPLALEGKVSGAASGP
jgi:hypothetical protein